jgi:hypothetical protein
MSTQIARLQVARAQRASAAAAKPKRKKKPRAKAKADPITPVQAPPITVRGLSDLKKLRLTMQFEREGQQRRERLQAEQQELLVQQRERKVKQREEELAGLAALMTGRPRPR